MSWGWTCPGLVLEPELSQGQKCLRASLVSRSRAGDVQSQKCLMVGVSGSSKAQIGPAKTDSRRFIKKASRNTFANYLLNEM
jgi:hypothetical protein